MQQERGGGGRLDMEQDRQCEERLTGRACYLMGAINAEKIGLSLFTVVLAAEGEGRHPSQRSRWPCCQVAPAVATVWQDAWSNMRRQICKHGWNCGVQTGQCLAGLLTVCGICSLPPPSPSTQPPASRDPIVSQAAKALSHSCTPHCSALPPFRKYNADAEASTAFGWGGAGEQIASQCQDQPNRGAGAQGAGASAKPVPRHFIHLTATSQAVSSLPASFRDTRSANHSPHQQPCMATCGQPSSPPPPSGNWWLPTLPPTVCDGPAALDSQPGFEPTPLPSSCPRPATALSARPVSVQRRPLR